MSSYRQNHDSLNIVPPPMYISSRLMAAIDIADDVTVHVNASGEWVVTGPEGFTFESGERYAIQWGAFGFRGYASALEDLSVFLGAASEDEEFIPEVHQWAKAYADELSALAYDLVGHDE